MKRVIITGDDFGHSRGVNKAVEEAHRRGVLGTASLMVGAAAAQDAVDRARELPSLHVGLHIVLVNGSPVLPPHTLPDLVGPTGEFSPHLFRAGVSFFFSARVRLQLEREIRAQFESYRKSGLLLDHVNCHNHMHLHPTVGNLILKVGREYGLEAMRYPYEPVLPSWRASRRAVGGKIVSWLLLWPWLDLLKRRMRRAKIKGNHFIFGLHDSGKMTLGLVLGFLRHLPVGVTEIYFHPASGRCPEMESTLKTHGPQEEFETLTDPAFRQALRASDIQTISFSDL